MLSDGETLEYICSFPKCNKILGFFYVFWNVLEGFFFPTKTKEQAFMSWSITIALHRETLFVKLAEREETRYENIWALSSECFCQAHKKKSQLYRHFITLWNWLTAGIQRHDKPKAVAFLPIRIEPSTIMYPENSSYTGWKDCLLQSLNSRLFFFFLPFWINGNLVILITALRLQNTCSEFI